jgi:hypothetical protein
MGTQSESREKPAIKARYENLTGDDLRGRIAAMGISQRAFAAKVGLSEGGLRYLIARRGNLVSHRVEMLLRAVEWEVAIGALLAATKPRAQIPKRALLAVYHRFVPPPPAPEKPEKIKRVKAPKPLKAVRKKRFRRRSYDQPYEPWPEPQADPTKHWFKTRLL